MQTRLSYKSIGKRHFGSDGVVYTCESVKSGELFHFKGKNIGFDVRSDGKPMMSLFPFIGKRVLSNCNRIDIIKKRRTP